MFTNAQRIIEIDYGVGIVQEQGTNLTGSETKPKRGAENRYL
jgi:hypothetical protein